MDTSSLDCDARPGSAPWVASVILLLIDQGLSPEQAGAAVRSFMADPIAPVAPVTIGRPPEESPGARAARLNRERQARYRERSGSEARMKTIEALKGVTISQKVTSRTVTHKEKQQLEAVTGGVTYEIEVSTPPNGPPPPAPPPPLNPPRPTDFPIARATPSEAERPAESPAGAYPLDFEAIWSAYPNRKGKGHAAKAWQAAKARLVKRGLSPGEAVDFVTASFRRWAQSREWSDGYFAHLATFLNQNRFDDEPEITDAERPRHTTRSDRRSVWGELADQRSGQQTARQGFLQSPDGIDDPF